MLLKGDCKFNTFENNSVEFCIRRRTLVEERSIIL